jgi:NADH-quinone oxidoreductase subunit C
MDNAALLAKISERFPDAVEEPLKDPKWVRGGDELRVKVPSGLLADIAGFLKTELGFDLLTMETAVDWAKENRFELLYFFQKSSSPSEKLFLKADLPREAEPQAPSLARIFESADWQEREIFDLFGISFTGHPDLRRILLWEGYPGRPLRKDYVHTPDRYDNGSEIGLPKAAS